MEKIQGVSLGNELLKVFVDRHSQGKTRKSEPYLRVWCFIVSAYTVFSGIAVGVLGTRCVACANGSEST